MNRMAPIFMAVSFILFAACQSQTREEQDFNEMVKKVEADSTSAIADVSESSL